MADYPYNGPWPRISEEVQARDGFRCQIRGPRCLGRSTTADHVIPWSEGHDPYDKTNLRAACRPCNSGRSQSRLAAQARLNRQQAATPSRDW